MLLTSRIHKHGTWLVVALTGDVDLSNADEMKRQIDAAIHTGATQVAVDLREVAFMDSTGLRVIIETHETLAAAGREFVIVTSEGPIERLFEITALDSVLPLRSDLPAPD